MTKILVGPVIGRVTNSSARLLVETDGPGEIAVRVLTPHGNLMSSQTLDASPSRPVAIDVGGLTAGYAYPVEIATNTGEVRRALVRPIAGDTLSAAAVSCFDQTKSPPVDMWGRLANAAEAQTLDIVFHMGDQVYADAVFRSHVAALKRLPRSAWKPRELAICEAYRRIYRAQWSRPEVQRVLAQVANLMIWDDHEIADDWGDKDVFADPNTAEHFVSCCGWRVYREYQRQLWDHEALVTDIGHDEGHWHRWGPIAALFVDVRGGRGFRRFDRHARSPQVADPYLSPKQWNRIMTVLVPAGGVLDKVRVLMVVIPVPLVYVAPKMMDDLLIPRILNDLRGHWGYRGYRREQFKFLSVLRNWKHARPGREVLLLSGDVHIGAEIAVRYRTSRDEQHIQQIVAGPIYQDPMATILVNQIIAPHLRHPNAELCTEPPTFRWQASKVSNRLNYARINIDATGSTPAISAQLVEGG